MVESSLCVDEGVKSCGKIRRKKENPAKALRRFGRVEGLMGEGRRKHIRSIYCKFFQI